MTTAATCNHDGVTLLPVPEGALVWGVPGQKFVTGLHMCPRCGRRYTDRNLAQIASERARMATRNLAAQIARRMGNG